MAITQALPTVELERDATIAQSGDLGKCDGTPNSRRTPTPEPYSIQSGRRDRWTDKVEDLYNTLQNCSWLNCHMSKRTPQAGFGDIGDAAHLDEIVVDRRGTKRAGKAKGRRRDRRYENRLLRTTADLLEEDADSHLGSSLDGLD